MSDELPLQSPDRPPTQVRHAIVSVATCMAVMLYLDRFAVGIASEYIREDLRMSQAQMSWFLSAFFWSYALGQVPAGWLSDRLGGRRMLALFILAWSAFTGLLGLATQVWWILYLRLFCGASQAGAYPTAGALIRVWFPISDRGGASAIVALGGRVGGVLAPILTAWLIILFSQSADPAALSPAEIVNEQTLLNAFRVPATDPRFPIVDRLRSRLPQELDKKLSAALETPVEPVTPAVSEPSFNLKDWQPTTASVHHADWAQPMTGQLTVDLRDPRLFAGVNLEPLKLLSEANSLVQKQTSGTPLTESESTLLNRLIVEAAFPGGIKRVRGTGWRTTMILYGIIGIAVALAVLIVVRDRPQEHPRINAAELALIDDEPTRALKAAEPENPPFPLVAMLTNLSLWGNSLSQVFTNIGWVFVVTWLPRYLDKVHGVPLSGQAIMTAIPTAAGILGMFVGGKWTDWATRAVGRKWGRRLPILVTRFTAALGYAFCLALSLSYGDGTNRWLPWGFVAALCLMAFSVDVGNPAVWAYAQDVGGKFTASILGWANMWGNLGTAAAPLIYNMVLGEAPTIAQWNLMFGLCTFAFILSGICSCVMDSTKSLVKSSGA